jgi:putative tricarboxylic transport membrane protein
MTARALRDVLVELAIALGLLALGIFVAVVASRMPATGGFSGVGPAAMPSIVATGLIITGLWLLAESLSGGWRQREAEPQARGEHAFFLPGFAWVSAGLFGQMALIHNGGFVLAATWLFTCVARGFGSTRPLRDAAIGLLMSLAIFAFFVHLLNVNLPAGWLKPLLGAAGI